VQREKILRELDLEIARLQQVRALLAADGSTKTTTKRKPGRPAGSGKLSLQGRKRIAEAMRKSWAERKKRAAAAGK
jgi:Fe-S cluster assembly ATPase SufC